MNNNIEKLLILTEIKQLDFLPKEFEARQSIQKKLPNKDNVERGFWSKLGARIIELIDKITSL